MNELEILDEILRGLEKRIVRLEELQESHIGLFKAIYAALKELKTK